MCVRHNADAQIPGHSARLRLHAHSRWRSKRPGTRCRDQSAPTKRYASRLAVVPLLCSHRCLEPMNLPAGKVRIAPSASARLTELRVQNAPVETGGDLYGGYDYLLKQIHVAAVSDVPPGTSQSPTALRLGPAGRTRLERNVWRRTAGKLSRVGTWHSHPSSGIKMSKRDRKTMESFRKEDALNGFPTLLIITSKEGDGSHLWI